MATIKVLAGDIDLGEWDFSSWAGEMTKGLFNKQNVDLKETLKRIELQTEESVKKAGGTVGWGLGGLALLGPLGAIGGMIIGGKGKKVLFAAYLKGNKKFLATTDGSTWEKLSAMTFQ